MAALAPLTKHTVGTLLTVNGSMALHIGGVGDEFPL
jgi:hypothetical protein